MKILFINSVCGIRSTGRIVTETADSFIAQGHTCRIAYGRENAPDKYKDISYRIGNDREVMLNGLKARLFDNEGFNAKKATKNFIKWADNYNPDMLWIHNIHGYYINIELLFQWIKSRPNMEVKWTLHDCWAFTGHCSYFSYSKCQLWQRCCKSCPQKKQYPASFLVDKSTENFKEKKQIFSGVNNMTLYVPSNWLKDLVLKSFLGAYPIEVLYNTIDYSQFKPTKSCFREQYGFSSKKIILGVSSVWDDRKGLLDFYELSSKLDDSYQIVIVGKIPAKLKKRAPKNIFFIDRTDSRKELAAIYTAADIFLNSSKEETFGLTTLEAIACGKYPIVYKDTACQEVVEKYGGIAVEPNVEKVYQAIQDILNSTI